MKIKKVRDVNGTYTGFWGDEIDVDSYPVQVVLHHLPDGLLRSSISAVDQERCWMCEHTGKIVLSEYCNGRELSKGELLWIYGGLFKSLKEVKEYLLDTDNLILEPEFIFADPAEEKVWNCYVPFYHKNVWKNLQELSQYLLGYVNRQDAETVKIAYGMYRYFSQGGQNVEEAWEILCEKEKEKETAKEQEEPIRTEQESPVIEKKRFPLAAWIIMGLTGASAVFLLTYVTLNEWYLSNLRKIIFFVLSIALGGISILFWKLWGPQMKKKNPLEEEENGKK